MISVASLLNPANSELRSTLASPSPSSAYSTSSSPYGSPLPSQAFVHKQRMAKDGAIFSKGKTKGDVNFPPFENLDENTLLEVEKYQVYPLGQIEECPRHIPYNSDKKSFLEKTGRESFEVFQYEFKLLGEEKTYTVMWDYNIGLVRITPFFKCCKYSKTTPAKMLGLNPGLKEITHSITGGALVAQGYWMPYSCALAVCATFCAHIAGALIPIFGPTFLSKCVPTSHQSYGLMVVDPSIITSATAEAESFRQQYSTAPAGSNVMKVSSTSPRELLRDVEHLGLHSPSDLSQRLRLKRTFTSAGMYNTDTDTSDTSMSSRDPYVCSPVTPTLSYTSSGWTADNEFSTPTSIPKRSSLRAAVPSFIAVSGTAHSGHRTTTSYGASPFLSAIPRSVADNGSVSTIKAPLATRTSPRFQRKAARSSLNTEPDEEYDGEESASGSECSEESAGNATEKKAAWLLLNLSVRDSEWAASNTGTTASTTNSAASTSISIERMNDVFHEQLVVESPLGRRSKRRRATSW